jgi:hypothetical protein
VIWGLGKQKYFFEQGLTNRKILRFFRSCDLPVVSICRSRHGRACPGHPRLCGIQEK